MALLFLALVSTAATVVLLSSRAPGDLLPTETFQDSYRLTGLAVRIHPTVRVGEGVSHVTLTFGDRCGTPLGLALVSQVGRSNQVAGPETQLWFTFDPTPVLPRSPLADPEKVVTLLRYDAVSDLVDTGQPGLLELELSDLGVPAPKGEAALRIDNLRGASGRPQASRRLPSARDLAVGSHCKLTARDLEALGLFARLLRARVCDDVEAASSRCHDTALVLFRTLEPDVYQADLRTPAASSGVLHWTLELSRDGLGRPAAVRVRALAHSSLGRSANLFFAPPRERGELFTGADPGFTVVRWDPAAPNLEPQSVSLDAVLGGTRWQESWPPVPAELLRPGGG